MIFDVEFGESSCLAIDFDNATSDFEVALQDYVKGVSSGDLYDGEYIVTPKADYSQELKTASKTLIENVKVLKVPSYSVDNAYGGQTISIGV